MHNIYKIKIIYYSQQNCEVFVNYSNSYNYYTVNTINISKKMLAKIKSEHGINKY